MIKRYINKVTGAIIDSSFLLSGTNWILEEDNQDPNLNEENENNDSGDEEDVDLEKMKVPELLEFAKEQGIELTKTKKAEIIEEIVSHFE